MTEDTQPSSRTGSFSIPLRRKKPRFLVQTSWGVVYHGRDLEAARRCLKHHRKLGELVAMFIDGQWYHHQDLS